MFRDYIPAAALVMITSVAAATGVSEAVGAGAPQMDAAVGVGTWGIAAAVGMQIVGLCRDGLDLLKQLRTDMLTGNLRVVYEVKAAVLEKVADAIEKHAEAIAEAAEGEG
jgi:hypothetical protein